MVAQLCRSREGTVLPIFALALFTILGCAAVAIDGARGYRTQTHVSAALDIAALATARELRQRQMTDAELRAVAQSYFDINIQDLGGREASYGEVDVQINRATNSVTLGVEARLPTTLARILSVDSLRVPATSTAVFDSRNIELSMMLDVSGSMQGSKLGDLQAAAGDLLRILFADPAAADRTRVAIAPYSTAVNAGNLAEATTGRRERNTCVTERRGHFAFLDRNPGRGNALGRRASWCPPNPVVPLSNDTGALSRAIGGLSADGSTAGHLGVAWAWYMLSPDWSDLLPASSRPQSYSDSDVAKVMIVMTDGMFNQEYESDNGHSAEQARELCRNIKSNSVIVYAVAFQAPSDAVELLSECASSQQHFFDAGSGAGLRAAFAEIARQVAGLRLKQ